LERRQNLKNKIIAIIGILIIILIFVFFNNFQKENVKMNKSLLLISVKEIKELSVIQVPYHKIVKNKKGFLCEITIILKGYVEGYINLENLREDDIKIKDDIVYITIPKPEYRFNSDYFNVFKENTAFCDRIKLINETIKLGENMILEDAKKDGIEKTIENRVKEVLSKFVKGLGYKDAQFIIKDSLRL
jgi:hypothetical protein